MSRLLFKDTRLEKKTKFVSNFIPYIGI